MCDFMAIILTILSQWWAIYKPDCGQQENRIKSESSARCPVVYVFRYGFLSFPIVYVSFDWIQIFNEFYKFPISRCVRRVVLECISYVTRIFPTHTHRHTWIDVMTLHTVEFDDDDAQNIKPKQSFDVFEIESTILLIACLHFFHSFEHAINSKQDRHGNGQAINYIRMLMVPLTRIFAD